MVWSRSTPSHGSRWINLRNPKCCFVVFRCDSGTVAVNSVGTNCVDRRLQLQRLCGRRSAAWVLQTSVVNLFLKQSPVTGVACVALCHQPHITRSSCSQQNVTFCSIVLVAWILDAPLGQSTWDPGTAKALDLRAGQEVETESRG